jgi:hypothetical protein
METMQNNNLMTLYVPCLPLDTESTRDGEDIIEYRIKYLFHTLDIAYVQSITRVPLSHDTTYTAAFINIHSWYNSPTARNMIKKLSVQKETTFVYDDPYFIILKNNHTQFHEEEQAEAEAECGEMKRLQLKRDQNVKSHDELYDFHFEILNQYVREIKRNVFMLESYLENSNISNTVAFN